MNELTREIKRHEKINDKLLKSAFIALLVCIAGLVMYLACLDNMPCEGFLEKLDDIATYIFDHILIWVPGSIFIVFFVCLVLLQFIGINIGPKY